MTDDNHPITPPQSLISERRRNLKVGYDEDAIFFARWGADQELDACCDWVGSTWPLGTAKILRAARRPKPPSLKEQALAALETQFMASDERDIIRRALEALPD